MVEKGAPPKETAPQKQQPPKPTTTTVKERDIIQQSREANVASGSAPANETIVVRDDGWRVVEPKRKVKRKKKAADESSGAESAGEGKKTKPAAKSNLTPIPIQTSNRPRTVGNQLQYYLFLMDRGQILTTELQKFINDADPITFITKTKPSMKQKAYESFTNWVSNRKRRNRDDMKDVERWKVSIPDHMNPTNPAYVDTTISAKRYYELEDQRLSKKGNLLAWFYNDQAEAVSHETISFRPKDKLTAIARNIKRKLKLNFLINLRIADNTNNLKMDQTADQANIKDGMTIIATQAVTEQTSSESATERIIVKVLRPSSNKPWAFSLDPTASTSHLYHEVATQTHTRTTQFNLQRSNGVHVSRYITIADLHLRQDEVLIIRRIEPIVVDTFWLDANNNEAQNKITYLDRNLVCANLGPTLAEELLLDFEFITEIQGQQRMGEETIGSLATEGGKIEVCIRRIGQTEWHSFDYENVLVERRVMSMVETNSGWANVEMIAEKLATIADFAQLLYKTYPELKGKVLEDSSALPYQLTDKLYDVIPTSGLLHVKVNLVQQYTNDQVQTALQTLAAQRETTVQGLVDDTFNTFAQW